MWEKFSKQKSDIPSHTNLFDSKLALEPFTVIFDPCLETSNSSSLDFLRELTNVENINTYSYRGVHGSLMGVELKVGEYCVNVGDLDESDILQVFQRKIDSTQNSGVWGYSNYVKMYEDWQESSTIREITSATSLLAFLGSTSLHHNIFVTRDPFLLAHQNLGATFILNELEALGFLGLYMRLQNRIAYFADGRATLEADRAWSEFLEVRYSMDKVASFSIHDNSSGDWQDLLRGALQRAEQLLRIRDDLAIYQMNQGNSLGIVPVTSFETFALFGVGLFDCIAKAINSALAFDVSDFNCKFQNSTFEKKLESNSADAYYYYQNSCMKELLSLLKEFRNTVHEQPSGFTKIVGTREDYLIRLSQKASASFIEHQNTLGLSDCLGFRDRESIAHVKSLGIVEILLPAIFLKSNELVDLIQWPRNHPPPPLLSANPSDWNSEFNAIRNHSLYGIGI